MIPGRWIFGGALVVALFTFVPLRFVLEFAGGAISARSVEGTVWNGRLIDASIGGQPLGDLDASLSGFALFRGTAKVKMDGAALHGASLVSFSGRGADVQVLNLPLARTFGPGRIDSVEVNDAHVRFDAGRCAKADGRVGLKIATALGNTLLSGSLRCSGSSLAADLVSQSAMERLSLRFSDAEHYQAMFAVRATDTDQATRLAAAGFREIPAGHMMKFSGTF